MSVRAALNKYERATNHGLSFANVIGRARTPTLMLAPFTPSHRHAITGFRESRSACLSLHRARIHVPPRSKVAVAIHAAPTFNGFGARCRRKGKLAAARFAWGNC